MVLPILAAILKADPAARFDAFMKARPAFIATVEVSAGGKVVGTGILRIARPRLLRFDAKGEGFDYAVASTPETFVELDRADKVYDERASLGGFRLYASRIGAGPQSLLPTFLLANSTANVLGGQKPTVAAVTGGDELKVTIQTQLGPVELRLTVGPDGQPLRYATAGATQGGPRTWRVTAFTSATADPAPFRLPLPLGYVPHTVPDLPEPLAIGEPAPLTGWQKGGRPIDLNEPNRGAYRLLAVLSADSPPSVAARPFLIELGRSMPVFLLEKGGVEDPTGALMRRLSPAGTPMFYLVGPDGTVKRLWLGFDPAKGKAWEDEVRAATVAKGGK